VVYAKNGEKSLHIYVEGINARVVILSVMEQGPAHQLLDAEAGVVALEQVDSKPI
jgi:hypothetical protein